MWRKWGVLLALTAVSTVLLIPICNLLHRCGCRAPWSGGLTHCNVRSATGPHCPWCEHQPVGGVTSAAIVGAQLLLFARARRRSGLAAALVLAFLVLLPLSVGLGGLAWLATDYPHFLVHGARARLGLPAGPLPCSGAAPHAH